MRPLWLLGLLACHAPTARAEGPAPPVLVELFSSEGCSSCPPAEDLLRAIAADGKLAGVPVVALELHVDYWNDLGWADPFSRADFSARQRAYGKAYTPEAVVDGAEDLVGSRRGALEEAVVRAASKPHLTVSLARENDTVIVRAPATTEPATVMFAIADRGKITSVPRGENAGRTLAHGPIVSSLRALGPLKSAFEARVPAPAVPGRRFVAFVQLDRSRRVIGTAAL